MKTKLLNTLLTATLSCALFASMLNASTDVQRAEPRFITLEENIAFKEHRAQVEEEAQKQAEEGEETPQAKSIISGPTLHLGQYQEIESIGWSEWLLEYDGQPAWSIRLADFSEWVIRSKDRYTTTMWLTSDVVTIKANTSFFRTYDFLIENMTTGEQVQADLQLTPELFGPFSYWIIDIDYLRGEVILSDGSIWDVRGYDYNVLNKWLINDHIIIGINDSFWTKGKSPNLLINANTKTYIHVGCQN